MFNNKVVWITGASSGIGEALVGACAAAGARVVLSSRRESELLRVQQAAGLSSDTSLVLPMDMSLRDDFNTQTQLVISKFGSIDFLFHVAGISQRSLVKDTSIEIDEKLMWVNFLSVVALTKAVLPQFLKQQSGHILVMSSLVGKFGTPMRSAYSASKHALHGYFESLRAEVWKQNIYVTIACPGYIKTNISLNAVNASGGKYGKMDENQASGMSADECARKILNGVRKHKKEILIGGKEILGVYLKRFFPGLLWLKIRDYNIAAKS
ncbi:MAG: SDR family oxidoreductase [Chitinophagaceae bacterium]|nr:SDR family oxidoreductase [Chitinophagaceae bacterium]